MQPQFEYLAWYILIDTITLPPGGEIQAPGMSATATYLFFCSCYIVYDTIIFINFASDVIMHVIIHSCGVISIIASCICVGWHFIIVLIIDNISMFVSEHNPFVFFAGNIKLMYCIYYHCQHGQYCSVVEYNMFA